MRIITYIQENDRRRHKEFAHNFGSNVGSLRRRYSFVASVFVSVSALNSALGMAH